MADDKAEERIRVRLVVFPTEDTTRYYVNYMEVTSSENDFTIYGVRVPSKIPPNQIEEDRSFHVEPELEITFSATIIQGLIDALINQRDAYSKDFGTPWTEKDKRHG